MIYIILMTIVSIGVALFAVQNALMVEVSFLIWTFTTSLVMVILSSLLAGLFIAFCWGLKLKAQHYLRDKKVQERVAELEQENTRLQDELKMLMHVEQKRAAAASKTAVSEGEQIIPSFKVEK